MSDLANAARGRESSKRTYTDADTRKWLAGPGESVGEWQTPPGLVPPTGVGDKNYDPFAALNNARQFANENAHFIAGIEGSDEAAGAEQARLQSRTGLGAGIADAFKDDPRSMIRNVAAMASLPMTGPAAAVLNGGLLADAAYSAYQDPSKGNLVGLGMAAVPAAHQAYDLYKGGSAASKIAQEAKAVKNIRSTYGAGDMGAFQRGMQAPASVRALEEPTSEILRGRAALEDAGRVGPVDRGSRVGYREGTPFNPADAHQPNTPGNVQRGSLDAVANASTRPLESPVDRWMPNTPSSQTMRMGGGEGVVQYPPPSRSPMDEIDRWMPNTPASIEPLMGDLPRAMQELSTPGAQAFMNREFAANAPIAERVLGNGANRPITFSGANGAKEAAAARGRVNFGSKLDAGPQAAQFRGAVAHGTGGFANLPEISGSESDRIAASIARIMGR